MQNKILVQISIFYLYLQMASIPVNNILKKQKQLPDSSLIKRRIIDNRSCNLKKKNFIFQVNPKYQLLYWN